jgi:hypothetical protein
MVCEGSADFRTVHRLVDLKIINGVHWIDERVLDDYREWNAAPIGDTNYIKWSFIKELRKKNRRRIHGNFKDGPGCKDFHTAKSALRLFKESDDPPDIVLLIRDTDGDYESTEKGLTQAEVSTSWPFGIILGLAHPKREAWILAGFTPKNETEINKLKEIRRECGFDPTLFPERLDARKHGAKKDIKRVLDYLTESNKKREDECHCLEILEKLENRDCQCGLKKFLKSVEEIIVLTFKEQL